MHTNRRQPDTDDLLVELRDLLAAFEANELSEEQDARLRQLVTEEETARRFYVRYMFMYGVLYQKHRKQKKHSVASPSQDSHEASDASSSNHAIFPLLEMEKDLLSSSGEAVDNPGGPATPGWGDILGRINFSFVPLLITIIAATLIVSAVVVLPIYWANRPTDPRWAVVAQITQTIDCQWTQGEKWSQEGSFLTSGQLLDLEAGLVEVEFSSGATIILQGPARFITAGHNDSRLDLGRLAAVVPKGAEGFTVRTPGMDVVDLGTEFGVSVDPDNKSDVHVFNGLVEMELATPSGEPKIVRVKKNEAIEYDKTSGSVAHIPVDGKKFVRDFKETGEISIKLRVVPQSGTVSSENVVGMGTNSSHFGSVIYTAQNGPIKITGTITDWTGRVNSNWRGLWTCISLTPTHFFKMNGTSVTGYPHLGDTHYGQDRSHQMGLGALGMVFFQKEETIQTLLEDYRTGKTDVSNYALTGSTYDFEIIYDFEAKTMSGSFNGSAFVTCDISEALAESDSFLLQVFATNNSFEKLRSWKSEASPSNFP